VQDLIELWAERAVAFVDELRENGELALILKGGPDPNEPDQF
jgi:hypothetical protein